MFSFSSGGLLVPPGERRWHSAMEKAVTVKGTRGFGDRVMGRRRYAH